MSASSLAREPLLHFLAAGLLLFVAFEMNDTSHEVAINLTASDISAMRLLWESQWRRPPTDQELANLIELRIREEIYARQAAALGLDQGDGVVRRRLALKLENRIADLASLDEPSSAQLRAYYSEHREDYRQPADITFEHRFFSADSRREQARQDAIDSLSRLNMGQDVTADPFPGPTVTTASVPALSASFGNSFGQALLSLARAGQAGWSGPVQSAYGEHVVRIDGYQASSIPEFGAVRERVLADWVQQQVTQAQSEQYAEMRRRYRINIAIQK
ncbi:MAG: peptidylprolyl isomerase [Proteobacteria bacterium]|jgi:peptidyl-prolyl cis-trans isomerase C|nr:peptidylprolyl isomerase [Pseudomonadota bacterium]MDA1300426.1 peptidylprolyl isomerase [Pseudomonadota bacterium]